MNPVPKAFKSINYTQKLPGGSFLKPLRMITQKNLSGYDPDQFDQEPADYVNDNANYPADDLSRDTADELIPDDDDDLVTEDDDLADDDLDLDDDTDEDDTALADDDLSDDYEEEDVDEDELDDTDVDEDDAINDDVTDNPVSDPAAHREQTDNPVYIKDMPYVDHATPGVTSH